MNLPRRLVSFLLVFLVALSLVDNNNHLVLAQREQSTVAGANQPGDGDIAIMQKEIKWGMQEMQRYKTLKGEWPVRVVVKEESNVVDFSRDSTDENGSMRGRNKPKETAHSSY